MRGYTISSVCFLAAFILISDQQKPIFAKSLQKRDGDTYTTKYDNIDIQRIVTSKRLMNNYTNCLLDKGPCTPEGHDLKTYLPDALQTKCSKCSEKQKKLAGIVLAHLAENYRTLFDDLLDKYDHDGSFRKEYEGTDDEEDAE